MDRLTVDERYRVIDDARNEPFEPHESIWHDPADDDPYIFDPWHQPAETEIYQ